jgi:predicted nucleic acid-binding protein
MLTIFAYDVTVAHAKRHLAGTLIMDEVNREIELFVSPQIVAELERVLDYPRIRKNLEAFIVDQLIERRLSRN